MFPRPVIFTGRGTRRESFGHFAMGAIFAWALWGDIPRGPEKGALVRCTLCIALVGQGALLRDQWELIFPRVYQSKWAASARTGPPPARLRGRKEVIPAAFSRPPKQRVRGPDGTLPWGQTGFKGWGRRKRDSDGKNLQVRFSRSVGKKRGTAPWGAWCELLSTTPTGHSGGTVTPGYARWRTFLSFNA